MPVILRMAGGSNECGQQRQSTGFQRFSHGIAEKCTSEPGCGDAGYPLNLLVMGDRARTVVQPFFLQDIEKLLGCQHLRVEGSHDAAGQMVDLQGFNTVDIEQLLDFRRFAGVVSNFRYADSEPAGNVMNIVFHSYKFSLSSNESIVGIGLHMVEHFNWIDFKIFLLEPY